MYNNAFLQMFFMVWQVLRNVFQIWEKEVQSFILMQNFFYDFGRLFNNGEKQIYRYEYKTERLQGNMMKWEQYQRLQYAYHKNNVIVILICCVILKTV